MYSDKIKLVQKKYRRRRFLMAHITIYAMVMMAMWFNFAEYVNALNIMNLELDYPALITRIIMTIGWALFVVLHMAHIWLKESEERAIMDILNIEGKSKRSEVYEDNQQELYTSHNLQLSDDGELIDPHYIDETEPEAYPNHR